MEIIGFAVERWCFQGWGMVDFGFVLIWFPSMGEIQQVCDMYMDEAGIPMLVTMSKESFDLCSKI